MQSIDVGSMGLTDQEIIHLAMRSCKIKKSTTQNINKFNALYYDRSNKLLLQLFTQLEGNSPRSSAGMALLSTIWFILILPYNSKDYFVEAD